MTDLLPCPFCGAKAAMSVLEDDEPGEIISAWVACSCGVELHEQRTEDDAAKCWNTRASSVTINNISNVMSSPPGSGK